MEENKNLKEDLEEDDEEEEGEEKSNIKKSEGCGCALLAGLLIFLLVAGIVFLYAVGVFDKKSSSSNSQTGGVDNVVESIVYRNLENGDFTISYDSSSITRVVITIQANTDIKEFSASVYLYDDDKNVIDSQNVSYSNMASGSRYEVVFNLSLSESWNLDSYGVKNIRGKVKK